MRIAWRACLRICCLLLGVLTCLSGCRPSRDSSTPKSEPPAVVAKPGEESALNTITLTPQAEQRLGIVLAEVGLADVRQVRQVGGEVVVPVGQTVIVAAPIDGTLAAAPGHPVPLPGSHLEPGQTVFELAPLLTPERDVLTLAERLGIAQTRANMATAQLEAERQIESARLNVEATQLAYNRAVQLLEKQGRQPAFGRRGRGELETGPGRPGHG